VGRFAQAEEGGNYHLV